MDHGTGAKELSKTTVSRALMAAAALCTFGPGSSTAAAQGLERLLLLIPRPDSGIGREYVVEFAAEARQRLNTRYRHRMTIIQTNDICRLLSESAFPCDIILEPPDAERLARALQADVYLVGRVWRSGASPNAEFRMVDIGRSGMSGWVSLRGAAGDPPRRLADVLVDSLNNQIRASELVRECGDQRDRGNFRGALEAARRVFQVYPNHPAAALCAAVVAEAMQLPVDSQIVFLERAVGGDSLSDRTWERLGRLYQLKGDSVKALEAFRRQALLNPGDRQLWRGVISGYLIVRDYDGARKLADEWLARQPGDLEFVQLRTRACFEGERWGCAVESLGEQYRLDSALARDSVFYRQILSAAQAAGDTQAMLRWSQAGIERYPNNVAFWLVRAGIFSARAADTTARASGSAALAYRDSALAAFDRVLQLNPADVATGLHAARMLLDGLVIDTLTPLDTLSLFRGGEYLDLATSVSQDTAVLLNAAVLYSTTAEKLVQAQRQIPLAVAWLEKALEYDVRGLLTQRASFFLGWGLLTESYRAATGLQPYVERYQSLSPSQQGEACALVAQLADVVRRGKQALQTGRALSPQTADQLLRGYDPIERNLPQYRQAFKCG